MKTRTNPKGREVEPTAAPDRRPLPVNDENPPRLLIISKKISKDATVMTFPHPRTLAAARYYVCPNSGLYELQRIAAPPMVHGSWMLQSSSTTSSLHSSDPTTSISRGYISKSPEVFVTTPIDPIFLLLPALEGQSFLNGEGAKRQFLSLDDLLEPFFDKSMHLKELVHSALRTLMERRLAAVCDTLNVDDTLMYRLNDERLFQEILLKAKVLAKGALPYSMEDRFVNRPLEKPASATTLVSVLANSLVPHEEPMSSCTETQDHHAAIPAIVRSDGSEQKGADALPVCALPVENTHMRNLQRLKTAFSFIVTSYFTLSWAQFLSKRLLAPESSIDFTPLENYLVQITKLKADALEARPSTDFSRKRNFENEEVAAERAEKRKKMDEETKQRKAGESRAVRDLKKVDVSGMKKMSDFFKKIPVK